MRVIIAVDQYGDKMNCVYNYHGVKRKASIIRAINEFNNDLLKSRYPIVDIRTSKN